jgi:hypothetical protein
MTAANPKDAAADVDVDVDDADAGAAGSGSTMSPKTEADRAVSLRM